MLKSVPRSEAVDRSHDASAETSSEPCYRLCDEAVIQKRAGTWLVTNPRTHRHVELNGAAVRALSSLSEASSGAWGTAFSDAKGWDRSGLDLSYGLWSDPSGCVDRRGAACRGQALFELLQRHLFLVLEDQRDYDDFLAPLSSLLDRDHLGTFHQRVGQHLLLEERVRDSWRWWHDQKFEPNGTRLKPTPYKWVQEAFFDRYFGNRDLKDSRVLDFGCGNGYFTGKFAALGATPLGLDTCSHLIDIARRNHAKRAEFQACRDTGHVLEVLQGLPMESFARIYMSDTFLLLFDGLGAEGLRPLLQAFRRLLLPEGRIHMMEPNPIFWLACRLGSPDRPSAAVTEYRDPLYGVAPTLDRLLGAMAPAGFALVEYLHPELDKEADADAALRAFARQFPLWDFLTFEPRRGP